MSELWQRFRWFLLIGAAVVGLTWALSQIGDELPEHALAIAPEGSRLVAEIDVNAVITSHLWLAILEEDEDAVRRIEETCGYDPLDLIDRVVIFFAGDSEEPFEHLGVVAQGEMARGRENREQLVACVQQVVAQDGGSLQEVEIEGERAVASSHGSSHAMFVGSDAVVGGDRLMVTRTGQVSRGELTSASGDADLRRLWDRVSRDRDAVMAVRLPERWLPSVRRLARSFDAEGDLDALGSVEAIGLGVRLRDGLAVGAALQTRSPADATSLESAIQARIDDALSERRVRLSSLGGALRRVQTEPQESDVVVTFALTDDQLDDLLELWRELRAEGASDREGGGDPEPDAEPEVGSNG